MYIKSLYLRYFRNYEEAKVIFSPGINLISGENAQGKTNLLEALHLISTGRSFRTKKLTELIQIGKQEFYLEALIVKEGQEESIKLFYNGHDRKVQCDKTLYTSFSKLLGNTPFVVWTPRDSDLISGPPLERRRFLDVQLSQGDPLYLHHLVRYHHALKERNHLLKNTITQTLSAWEEVMALSANYVIEKRRHFIESSKEPLRKRMESLSSGKDVVTLHYHPAMGTLPLLEQYQRDRAKEFEAGSTLHGPHRDDFSIHINDKNAKIYASEGQKRTIIAALRLLEWDQLHQKRGLPPILSIDDFGVHLDQYREEKIQKEIIHLGQVFLTSPEFLDFLSSPEQISSHLVKQGMIIHS